MGQLGLYPGPIPKKRSGVRGQCPNAQTKKCPAVLGLGAGQEITVWLNHVCQVEKPINRPGAYLGCYEYPGVTILLRSMRFINHVQGCLELGLGLGIPVPGN